MMQIAMSPIFALIICLASAFYCYRLSYNSLILAVGHYKQTQGIFITAAIINMLTSILLVMKFGLVGVALGTLLSDALPTHKNAMVLR